MEAAGSPPADASRAGNPAAPTETINLVDGFFYVPTYQFLIKRWRPLVPCLLAQSGRESSRPDRNHQPS